MAEDSDNRPPKSASGTGAAGYLKDAPWLAADHCQAVFEALQSGGYPARAVGGAVRNELMGLEVTDVDIATPAVPDEVTRLCQAAGLGVHATGLAHGTLTVVSRHVPYEVTTLRRDVETHGRHATIAFTEDWSEDAARRDFTMNAIYCDRHGAIHDPLGGFPDLLNRRVRFIGSARDRICEDYLRILRFFRFFAAYARGPIDQEGLAAAVKERDGLLKLSAERIRLEMLKLLVAPRAHDALTLMAEHGIAQLILGQNPHLDRFDKLVALESALGLKPDPILRLAVLSVDNEQEARVVSSRLRLSNDERRQLVAAAGSEACQFTANRKSAKAALYRMGKSAYCEACLVSWAKSEKTLDNADMRAAIDLPNLWQAPDLPFKGADIVALGTVPGPEVGKALSRFEVWWIEADFPDDKALLLSKLKEFAGC